MKVITIRLYGWKDFTEWFWDKFCFPRRQAVTEWIEVYTSDICEAIDNIYLEHEHININNKEDEQRLYEFSTMVHTAVCEKSEKIIESILKYK